MRSLITYVLVVAFFATSGLQAQTREPAAQPETSVPAGASNAATKAEVDQLRGEVAAQRQLIEDLKTLVEKLAQEKTAAAANVAGPIPDAPGNAVLRPAAVSDNTAHLADAVLRQPELIEAAMVDQAAPATAKKDVPLTAGWNGEHFFIRSADGQFTLSPYGYVNTDYRAYQGDGAPADTFLLRRARFGFQGSFGSHFDFALLTDAAATSGSVVRDVYLNVRVRPELQFQAGQFKVPFGQETGLGVTNLDFIERGFQSMLVPSAASAYRSPGAVVTETFTVAGCSISWARSMARGTLWPIQPTSRKSSAGCASTHFASPRIPGTRNSLSVERLTTLVRRLYRAT